MDWKLKIRLEYVKTRPDAIMEDCPASVHYGGLFSYGDPDECSLCNGSSRVYKKIDYTPKPKIPDELLSRLEKTCLDYFKELK